MKIARVCTRPVRSTGGDPGLCIVELISEDGASGAGFAPPSFAELATSLAENFLIGEDPRATAWHWQRMTEGLRDEPANQARAAAALDTALWDLRAKRDGEPLWKTLGGGRPRVLACAFAPDSARRAADARPAFGEARARHGFRAGCLELGEAGDAERLQALRDGLAAAGNRPDLLAAVPADWSPGRARDALRSLEADLDITMLYAPWSRWGRDGFRQVGNGVFAGLCPAEPVSHVTDLFRRLDHDVLDALRIDPALTGVTGSLQAADAAFGYELPVTIAGGPGGLGAHLAAAMPTAMYLEVPLPGPFGDALDGGVSIHDGWAAAGDAPGHGIAPRRADGGEGP